MHNAVENKRVYSAYHPKFSEWSSQQANLLRDAPTSAIVLITKILLGLLGPAIYSLLYRPLRLFRNHLRSTSWPTSRLKNYFCYMKMSWIHATQLVRKFCFSRINSNDLFLVSAFTIIIYDHRKLSIIWPKVETHITDLVLTIDEEVKLVWVSW